MCYDAIELRRRHDILEYGDNWREAYERDVRELRASEIKLQVSIEILEYILSVKNLELEFLRSELRQKTFEDVPF